MVSAPLNTGMITEIAMGAVTCSCYSEPPPSPLA